MPPLLASYGSQPSDASLLPLPVIDARAGVGGTADISQVFLDLLQKCRYTPKCKISSPIHFHRAESFNDSGARGPAQRCLVRIAGKAVRSLRSPRRLFHACNAICRTTCDLVLERREQARARAGRSRAPVERERRAAHFARGNRGEARRDARRDVLLRRGPRRPGVPVLSARRGNHCTPSARSRSRRWHSRRCVACVRHAHARPERARDRCTRRDRDAQCDSARHDPGAVRRVGDASRACAGDRRAGRRAQTVRRRGHGAHHSQPGDVGAARAAVGAPGRSDGALPALSLRPPQPSSKDSRARRGCRISSHWILLRCRRRS